jgi:hypothetical protein
MPFQKVKGRVITVYTPAVPQIASQIRFLGGKLGQAIADKFEVSTVGDLLYASPCYGSAPRY